MRTDADSLRTDERDSESPKKAGREEETDEARKQAGTGTEEICHSHHEEPSFPVALRPANAILRHAGRDAPARGADGFM